MKTLINIVVVTLLQITLSLIAAYVGWNATDLLSYGDWFSVCFVGTMIVRGGFWLEELVSDLTKPQPTVKIRR